MKDIRKPMIGVSTAFTGKYLGSQVIFRFLENLQFPIRKTKMTKPQIVEAGSTLASSDFCLPLRIYVGHIYYLLQEHPEIDLLITPIVKGEYPDSSTCAKYRDLNGVIIRSLGSIAGYHLRQSSDKQIEVFQELVGSQKTQYLLHKVQSLPRIIAPEIESIERSHMRHVCFKLYRDIMGKGNGKEKFTKEQLENAFEEAYEIIVVKKRDQYQQKLANEEKIRLAIVGRHYLTEDPALSADIKKYFIKKGVEVFTIQDIPFEQLKQYYQQINGFYDTHKLGLAFIDYVFEQVDGFIVIGSFGCHPDAFQVEYFSQYIRERGKPVWTFKFDEQTGGVGFHTRFETILGFLKQKRDERIQNNRVILTSSLEKNPVVKEVAQQGNLRPIFIWPHMGPGIDLLLKEIWYQLGLQNYLYPPKPVNEETIQKGNVHYTETCSPYAFSMGSVRQTLDRLLDDLEKEAKELEQMVEPRRIILLMARGKGPCTFGWYAIAGEKALREEYADKLKRYGHTFGMVALDNEGRDLIPFLQELANVAENDQIKKIIRLLDTILIDHGKGKGRFQAIKAEFKLIKQLKQIVWPGWQKLLAYEELQNKALVTRAHEYQKGMTTLRLKYWIEKLDHVHTLEEIEEIKNTALYDLDSIPQDSEPKPKVVVVGEIYVALTSFANRGTVDHLLGQHGIEAVEGMRLSHFIKGAFKGLKMHYLNQHPLLKPWLDKLEALGWYHRNRWVREPFANPFLEHEIGGDGQPTVAYARHHIEQDGVDGILHIYPFKCMPEGMAKDALDEMSPIYGVKSLHLSFDKEIEIERLRTEIGTFATLLYQDLERKQGLNPQKEIERRQKIGQTIEQAYYHSKKSKSKVIKEKAL
ncbi:acyl-CoA dehydratase activase-related protein [Tepidibacillus fermentans]|uniref:Putative nucleotide-binding protein (Sugar kinase/HSP70/actin superfamily) n=1 Tax=Tepidibacillus fermentans TaxID=1281767 RepID=A0A4R3KEM7_9BACI|nr:acyl-CoA dehydratase activase-related protein [Tepidibacillus fermentans]TCS81806.1 putative nucleotide-binding protein (sugar kinase/HSP70/actin superfamily) [Tepidibacillus fermentans]